MTTIKNLLMINGLEFIRKSIGIRNNNGKWNFESVRKRVQLNINDNSFIIQKYGKIIYLFPEDNLLNINEICILYYQDL
jgi:hypothetical protein